MVHRVTLKCCYCLIPRTILIRFITAIGLPIVLQHDNKCVISECAVNITLNMLLCKIYGSVLVLTLYAVS